MYLNTFPTAKESHQFAEDGKSCLVCGLQWQRTPNHGKCAGVPVFRRWQDIPEGMHTKTQLYDIHKKKLSQGQLPIGAKYDTDKAAYIPLYALSEARDVKPVSEAQKAALEKAQHMAQKVYVSCSSCGRTLDIVSRKEAQSRADEICHICVDETAAIEWAKAILLNENAVILDTETTDLDGEIIEIAVIDIKGNTLLNRRIKPKNGVSDGAMRIHGITNESLENEPQFEYIYHEIVAATEGKAVLVYNFSFDSSILRGDCLRAGLPMPKWASGSDCVMEWYAQFAGQWSNYWESYRWQKLEDIAGGDHSALGDCKATLKALHLMANYQK